MTKTEFDQLTAAAKPTLDAIRNCAHELHQSVNQLYDGTKPYGFHLDMVADGVFRYGHEICQRKQDVAPLFFGAWFHDSIEDARLTYNDVTRIARRFMDEEQAHMAAEIVYALTNEKGRTREERADERYYRGIRETPYAPFVKLCDRAANIAYSCQGTDESNNHMREVYSRELPHFLKALQAPTDDLRMSLPEGLKAEIETSLQS